MYDLRAEQEEATIPDVGDGHPAMLLQGGQQHCGGPQRLRLVERLFQQPEDPVPMPVPEMYMQMVAGLLLDNEENTGRSGSKKIQGWHTK